MYKVRWGVGKQIFLCGREFAPVRMVDGSHPCSHPCMGISVISGLWQQSRFNSYFNILNRGIRSKERE